MSDLMLTIPAPSDVLTLFGPKDQHLRAVRDAFDVAIVHRGGKLRVQGDTENARRAAAVLRQLSEVLERRGSLTDDDVRHALQGYATDEAEAPGGKPKALPQEIEIQHAARRVRPRTPGQASYVDAIAGHDLTFCIGPAGSGKTFLSVAMAVESFKSRRVRRIVLVRPAVEAGENLGFLPGDLRAKLNPYLRPLMDALHEMMDFEQVRQHIENDVIEVIPLAYMRGRTLNDAFIILDEAQNTTIAQMKMFLTRMGERSKMVVSGDVTQVDLPRGTQSGLSDALLRLEEVPGIAVRRLADNDIVRHKLVGRIVRAYEEQKEQSSN